VLLGQAVEVMLPAAMRTAHVALREHYVQAAEPRAMAAGRTHLRALGRDGRSFPVDVSLCPLKTPDGVVVVVAIRDTSERERMTEVVSGAARHLLQVINDILDLSRIEAGKLELAEVEFSRDDLLARVLEMVIDSADAKGLELIVDAAAVPERLVGDAKLLGQALINLLANAVQFTERGWVGLTLELLDGDA
jgi:signal transduction histidine kinase